MKLPLDTLKNQIVAFNGIPKVVCRVAPQGCLEIRPQFDRKVALYDENDELTTDYCDAVYAELPVRSVCCETVCAIVPDALAALPEGTPVFSENHPDDGSAIAPLAVAGAVFVGSIAPAGCDDDKVGYWDNLQPELPAGFAFAYINVASPNEAIAQA